MGEYDSDLSFPNLQQLTLRGVMEIDDLGSTPTPIFTKDSTPKLTRLALEEPRLAYRGFIDHFSDVTDQITTLAPKDSAVTRYLGMRSALAHLSKLRNLRHLSLSRRQKFHRARSTLSGGSTLGVTASIFQDAN